MTIEMKASVEKYLKAREEISFKYDAAGRKMWYRSTFIKLSDGTSFWNESPDHKITKALAQCFLCEYDLTIDEFVAAENEYFKAKAETTETKAEVAEVETTETKAEAENNVEEVKADELSEELIDEYIISEEAQTIATDAESELANKAETKEEVATETTEVKADRITELKAKSKGLWEKFRASLQGYYVNFNGNFFSTDDALDFTTFLNDKYDGLYRKDENGEYVKIESEEFDKINRIEIELDAINGAIHAEIARNAVKFVAGKWYTDSEGCKYLILKRTAKTVTVYNQDQDDWNALKSYDANDEIDGEFDCIFRKKIQFDERGEYVDWEDEDNELVQVFAKNETEPPTDDDDTQTETEQIEKRMSEIVAERDELYDALDEAEGNDEISQAWIDYLEEELEILLAEYNKLWARLEELKANQGNVA